MPAPSIKRTLWLSLGGGLLVMLLLALFADLGETYRALKSMNLAWLPLLLLFSLANYVTRYGRWEFFLRRLGLRLRPADSMAIFVGGFTFSVTPGKLGELFKSYLVKQVDGAPLARTAPVVLAERLTDLGGLLLLAAVGVWGSRQGGLAWLAGLALVLLFMAFLSSRRLERLLMRGLSRIPALGRRSASLQSALDNSRDLLRGRDLLPLILFSALAWFWECWGLLYAARAFGQEITLIQGVGIYSLATLLGALAFLPGGLGVTEGSLALMLSSQAGLAAGPAAAATLLIRATTLWFAVGLGLLALIWLDRSLGLGAKLWSGFEQTNYDDELPETGRSGSP
jgi:glycosyltransferase 2 family protein